MQIHRNDLRVGSARTAIKLLEIKVQKTRRSFFKTVLKVVLTITLAVLLAKWAMNIWPVPWLLHTERGMHAYVWLLTVFELEGCEDGEDMLILLTLSVTLIVSTLTCVALTRALRRWRRAPVAPNVE
jgi:hypothetical protein